MAHLSVGAPSGQAVRARTYLFGGTRACIGTPPWGIAVWVPLFFFYLYGVRFTFMPISTSRLLVICGACVAAIFVVVKGRLRIPLEVRTFLIIYCPVLGWTGLQAAAYGAVAVEPLTGTVLIIAHGLTGGLCFAALLDRGRFDFRDLVALIQAVIAIQAFFIVLYFISWDFREFTFQYIPEEGNIDHRLQVHRSRGLTQSSGASLSVVQAIGLLCTAYLVSESGRTMRGLLWCIASFALILFSILVTGRSGLLVLPLIAIYFLATLAPKLSVRKSVLWFVVLAPGMLIGGALLVTYAYEGFFGQIRSIAGEDALSLTTRWVLSEFLSADGTVQSRTIEALRGHWFLPDTIGVFLFGDPSTWALSRIPSDIGVIRMLHAIGAVGVVGFYGLYAFLFTCSVRMARSYEERAFLVLLAVFLLVLEAKEPFLFSVQISTFPLLVFCFLAFRQARARAWNNAKLRRGEGEGEVLGTRD
jgi:hypothetical protein